jgi:hypothetical protein
LLLVEQFFLYTYVSRVVQAFLYGYDQTGLTRNDHRTQLKSLTSTRVQQQSMNLSSLDDESYLSPLTPVLCGGGTRADIELIGFEGLQLALHVATEAAEESSVPVIFCMTHGPCVMHGLGTPVKLDNLDHLAQLLLASPKPKGDIRFDQLVLALNYFCASDAVTHHLRSWTRSPQDEVLNPVSSLTAFTALNVLPKMQAPLEAVLLLSNFSMRNRAQYACDLGKGDMLMEVDEFGAASALFDRSLCDFYTPDPAIALLTMLDPSSMVIAGGGAIRLGCPWVPWELNSDIDLFILNSKNRMAVISEALAILRLSGRVVCGTSPAVLTAVGVYGTRRIQLICSGAETPQQLISEFDLHMAKAFFDGRRLVATCRAVMDWQTRKCSNGSLYDIKPKRLIKAHMKGFELDASARLFLANTTGWPVPALISDQMRHWIPCLLGPGVPEQVQKQHLRRIGFEQLDGEPVELVNLTSETGFDGGSYGEEGRPEPRRAIYRADSVQGFVELIEHMEGRDSVKKSGQTIFTRRLFNCVYALELQSACLAFDYEPQETSSRFANDLILSKIMLTNPNEIVAFGRMHDAILSSLEDHMGKYQEFAKGQYPDVHVRIARQSELYMNGIKVNTLSYMPAGTRVRVVMALMSVVHRTDIVRNVHEDAGSILRFRILQLFVVTNQSMDSCR